MRESCTSPVDWCVTYDIQPSYTEKLICSILTRRQEDFYREVSFRGMYYKQTGGYARFDFWLPEYNLVFEYDGKDYHKTNEQKRRDLIKDNFCLKYGIKLIRLNKEHYQDLEQVICAYLEEIPAYPCTGNRVTSFSDTTSVNSKIGLVLTWGLVRPENNNKKKKKKKNKK